LGTPLTNGAPEPVEICPTVQARLATMMREAIRRYPSDHARLRHALRECIEEAKTSAIPPELVLGALKRILEAGGIAQLTPSEHEELTRLIVGWFLDDYYGEKV
jgi:hypothetical protein